MNDSSQATPNSGRSFRFSAFVIAQVAILCVALGAVSQRAKQIDAIRKLPQLRETPLVVEPTYDYPEIVSDEQLAEVLYKLRPRLRGEAPKINHVDHALRFWGVDAKFNDPQCLSGEEMRSLLTDHREFAKAWGEGERPLLRFSEQGVGVRTREGLATASHVDHTVAGLAEVGTPADFLIQTPQRRATMQDLLHYAMNEFQLNQTEYEWSALTFALYLPRAEGFVTSEGQQVTFDLLADRIMRQPYRSGVCYGNHRMHTLAMMLRIDDQEDIVSDETRGRILEHMLEATRRLIATQHADGYWDKQWSGEVEAGDSDPASNSESARILATGHALEWLSFAPQEVHPPRERLVRAGQWLSRTIVGLDDAKVTEYYTFLTHAGRALALWRAKFPVDCLPLAMDTPPAKEQSPANVGDSPAEANETREGQDGDQQPRNGSQSKADEQPSSDKQSNNERRIRAKQYVSHAWRNDALVQSTHAR